MHKPGKDKKDSRVKGGAYPLLGVSMPVCVLLGYLAGHFLDKKLGTSPYLLIGGILLGVGAAYWQLYKIFKKG